MLSSEPPSSSTPVPKSATKAHKRRHKKRKSIPSWATFNAFKQNSGIIVAATPDGLVPRLTERQQMSILMKQLKAREDGSEVDSSAEAIEDVDFLEKSLSVALDRDDDDDEEGSFGYLTSAVDDESSFVGPATEATCEFKERHAEDNDMSVDGLSERDTPYESVLFVEREESLVSTIEEEPKAAATIVEEVDEALIAVDDTKQPEVAIVEVVKPVTVFEDVVEQPQQPLVNKEEHANIPQPSPRKREREKSNSSVTIKQSPSKHNRSPKRQSSISLEDFKRSPKKDEFLVPKIPSYVQEHIQNEQRDYHNALKIAVDAFDMQNGHRSNWWTRYPSHDKHSHPPVYTLTQEDRKFLIPNWEPTTIRDQDEGVQRYPEIYERISQEIHSLTLREHLELDVAMKMKIQNLVEYQTKLVHQTQKEHSLQLFRFFFSFEHDVERLVSPTRKLPISNRIDALKQVSKELRELVQNSENYLVTFDVKILLTCQEYTLQNQELFVDGLVQSFVADWIRLLPPMISHQAQPEEPIDGFDVFYDVCPVSVPLYALREIFL